MAPTTMRMTPTVVRSTPDTESVTANLRMAPTAIRKSEVPSPMPSAVPGPSEYHAGYGRNVERRVRDPAGASRLPGHHPPDRDGARRPARGRDRRHGRIPLGHPQAL